MHEANAREANADELVNSEHEPSKDLTVPLVSSESEMASMVYQ